MDCSEKFLCDVPSRPVGTGIAQQVLGYDRSILMARTTFAEGSVGALHQHPHSQVTYVESGRFEVEIDGQTRRLGPGEAFYVRPDASHGAICLEAGVLIDVFSPVREDFLRAESSP